MSDNKELKSAIQNFAESIGDIADAIYDSLNNQTSDSSVDNTAITATFIEITAKLDVISERVESTNNNTNEILKLVKGINTKKEKPSLIDKLAAGKDASSNMGDSIATIGLMAASIMAMGLAFSVVGNVDFESVLALSVAMPLIAIAFKKAGEAAGSAKEAGMIALTMGIMSAGLLASGILLYFMPDISLDQLLTTGIIAVSLGIAMATLAYAADEIGNSKIGALYAIVPVMPVVAAAIALSSYALQNVQQLSGQQLLNVAAVGLAIALSMVPLAMAAKAAKGKIGTMYAIAGVMPAVAGGIWLSSLALANIPSTDFESVLTAVINIAPAMLLGIGVVVAMSKFKVGIKDALIGVVTIPAVALGIALASQALRLGHYKDTITYEWSKGFALGLLGAVPAVVVLGAIAASGIGAIVILAGIASMIVVAGGIAAASVALAGGNYKGGPTKEWASAVGLSLISFVNAIGALSPSVADMFFGGGSSLEDKIESIVKIGSALKRTAAEIKGGDYTGGPSKEWSEGVGLAIVQFTNAITTLSPDAFDMFFDSPDTLESKIESIVKIARALKDSAAQVKGGDYTGGPSKEWSEGVGMALVHFTQAVSTLDPGLMGWFTGSTVDDNIETMTKIAAALPLISKSVEGEYNDDKVPTKKWSEGVGMTLTAFADTMVKLEDEFEPEHIVEWSPAFRLFLRDIAYASLIFGKSDFSIFPGTDWSGGVGMTISTFADTIIKLEDDLEPEDILSWSEPFRNLSKDAVAIGSILNGAKFDTYPTNEWTIGVTAFLKGFSGITTNGVGVSKIIKNTSKMANANMLLAKSILYVGAALKKLGDVKGDGLNKVFGSLLTLSIIDDENLTSVLNIVTEKQNAFSGVMAFAKSKFGYDMIESGINGTISQLQAAPVESINTQISGASINKSEQQQTLQVEVLNFPVENVEDDNSMNNLLSELISDTKSTNILLNKLIKQNNINSL